MEVKVEEVVEVVVVEVVVVKAEAAEARTAAARHVLEQRLSRLGGAPRSLQRAAELQPDRRAEPL